MPISDPDYFPTAEFEAKNAAPDEIWVYVAAVKVGMTLEDDGRKSAVYQSVDENITIEGDGYKPHSFALKRGPDGAEIHFGQLLSSVTVLNFERLTVAGKKVNSLSSQAPIPKITTHNPFEAEPPAYAGFDMHESKRKAIPLGWWGNVYLAWTANRETGEITSKVITGPAEPDGQEIEALSIELERVGEDDGKYWILLGAVPEEGFVVQEIASDVTWAVTLVPEGSGGDSDGIGDDSDGGDPPTETEKSDNAIVAGPWAKGKFVALATMESNQVLFEFIVRDIQLKGPITRVHIDRRFLFVCVPGSLCVAAAPCGDAPYPVGASVSGGVLILTAQCRKDRRPKTVNVRLTGIRKGFKEWDMPSRTLKQKKQSEDARARDYDR